MSSKLTADYLTDERDRALFELTPVLYAPRFGSVLPPPKLFQRDYVCTNDGMYVRTRNLGVHLAFRVAHTPLPLDEFKLQGQLPFGEFKPQAQLRSGKIPRGIYDEIEQAVLAHHPKEWCGVVHWHEEPPHYRLTVPEVRSRSGGHINYETDQIDHHRLVLHVHSHGVHSAEFSHRDNETELTGCYFAAVFGKCGSIDTLEYTTRLVAWGHFATVDPPWEQ